MLSIYDLGKWFPELGEFDGWKARQVATFDLQVPKSNEYKIEECSTNTGGILLIAKKDS